MKGMKGGVILGALIASLGMSSSALAIESLKPKLAPPKVKEITREEFADLRAKLGACIVKNNAKVVAKYLAHSDSGSIDYKAMGVDPAMAMFMFRMEACTKYNVPQMGKLVFMAPGALRNLLLESSYLGQFAQAPKPVLDASGKPVAPPARTFASTGTLLEPAVAFAAIADCTAEQGLDLADAVLRTGVNLADERAAAVALAPVIGACVPAGVNLSMTPTSIRTIAAEGLWYRYAATLVVK